METTLGKPHSQSPFTGIYAQYGFSTGPAIEEEEKKEPQVSGGSKATPKADEKKIPAEKKPKAPKEAAK
jgi:hypothetical protein